MRIAAAFFVISVLQGQGLRDATAPEAQRAAGFDPQRLARVADAVRAAVESGAAPGAVVLVGRGRNVVLREAFGLRSLEPREEMSVDTIFDLASLTKVVCTAPLVMSFVDEGRIRLQDKVARHWPEFARAGGGRESITIEQCLIHRAGFVADDPLDLYHGGKDAIFEAKNAQKLARTPGSEFTYSDVGFEVLGEVLERVGGKPLERLFAERIAEPLTLRSLSFRRLSQPAPLDLGRVAPSEAIGGTLRRGEVHDPRAHALDGVAGHAGLFGTADDLARFVSCYVCGGAPVLSAASTAAMARPTYQGDAVLRGLGWDLTSPFSIRGDLFPLGSFGHTGFTGTSVWIEPETKTFVILLANPLLLEKGTVVPLRPRISNLVAAALADVDLSRWRALEEPILQMSALARSAAAKSSEPTSRPTSKPAAPIAEVRAGVDVLEKSGFAAVAGKRIALLTNPTGAAADGRSTIDLLCSPAARAADVTLVRLFSPEHGIRADADDSVGDSVDAKTRLPIRSLYGESRRPSQSDLEGLDAVVVDLQDVGCRFYTYLAAVGYVMEECAKAKVAVIVLDRPNPIRADRAEGPIVESAENEYVAYHKVPIRTGLTMGEHAKLVRAERGIDVDLRVVPLEGYRRSQWFDETGFLWVSPSPNLRTLQAATLYPGICLLEMTNISVGRGTETPFEILGAPWIDGRALAETLRAHKLPGIGFVPVKFTPSASTFAGEACGGIRFVITDRDALRPVELGFEIACALRDRYTDLWKFDKMSTLLAHPTLLANFRAGASAPELARSWSADLAAFESRARAVRIYP